MSDSTHIPNHVSFPLRTDKRSFWALMLTQFCGAFNDNLVKIVVALLLVRWMSAEDAKTWVAVSGAVFAIPFLLFSLASGRIADRWSKARVMLLAKLFDLPIVLIVIAGVYLEQVGVLMTGLFLLASQSAFFSPAKYGLLPELCSEKELASSNALLNASTFVAILSGSVVGAWVSGDYHRFAFLSGSIALASFVGACLVKNGPAMNPQQLLRWNPLPDFLANWKLIQPHPALRKSILAVSFFWFAGGVTHLNLFLYVDQVLRLPEKMAGFLLSAVVIGIATGSLLAGRLSKEKIQTKWVPLGSCGMGLFLLDLYFSNDSLIRSLADCFLMGAFAGLYVIPFNTLIQLRSPERERGRILSTVGLLSFVAILGASAFLWAMGGMAGAAPDHIFLALGVLCFVMGGVILQFLPSLK
ncbi:MAG: Lysophospholipid transporter LplT [Elusimicrobia bacterium]|nr:Lysophospholipid transporter LplT [Elusimicrobiota bacterium]